VAAVLLKCEGSTLKQDPNVQGQASRRKGGGTERGPVTWDKARGNEGQEQPKGAVMRRDKAEVTHGLVREVDSRVAGADDTVC